MTSQQQFRVLIVDDEPSILQFLDMGLGNEGYIVHTAKDGIIALNEALEFQPHVVILDVMMPGLDGFEVCRQLKSQIRTAVIMLTARDEVDDRVHGLTLGADDYMIKPFSFQELLARIQARLRNLFPELGGIQFLGPFQLNTAKREIHYQGTLLELSPTEYRLLHYLLVNHGAVLSKRQILEHIWDYDFNGEENIVEVYIRALREKLGDTKHKRIKTVRGAGYRIEFT
ncbi:MAG: response regulator transcription factor [Desulfitobacteriaceae bacterium]|nr:response regulator transcription factor [Desulfitobacteriaceae bacterium]MDI6915840.1 response regulator transcription factor [Desulfitobacteriaceae bacterium]